MKYPHVLEGYSDVNCIADSEKSKSISGYIFSLGDAVVSWKSSKQTCIARSTMELEFITLDKAAEEAEWLRQFLKNIPLWSKPVLAICIHCDNQAVILRAQNFIYNSNTRHIRRRHNIVRQLLSNGVISIDFVASKDNLKDPFTKKLSGECINCALRKMRLKA